MAILNTKSFSAIVQQIAAGVQGRATTLVDFGIGSILRAIAEGFAGVALWLESLILQVYLIQRAATSTGTDLDTFVADWGLTRLGSANAKGYVQFTSFTATAIRYIPIGTTVKTADLSQTFTVTADATNAAYDAVNQRYTLAAGVAALIVPVSAVSAGAGGNVAAQTVSIITSNVAGIDTVLNLVAFTGGSDPEADPQLRARFIAYIRSLSKATTGAIGYALQSLQVGIQYAIHENAVGAGIVTIYIDDGSGNIPTGVVQNAQAIVDKTRAAGVRAVVLPAISYPAFVQMSIKVAPGYLAANVTGAVSTAIAAYVNNLGLEAPLFYTRIAATAYSVPGVQEVVLYSINNTLADIVPQAGQTLKSSGVAVSGS